jgi:hypothetical protein
MRQKKNPTDFSVRFSCERLYALDITMVAEDTTVEEDGSMRSLLSLAILTGKPVPVPMEGTGLTTGEGHGKIDHDLVLEVETDGDGLHPIQMDAGTDEVASGSKDKLETEEGEHIGFLTRSHTFPCVEVEVAVEEGEDGGDDFHNRKETTTDYL